MRSQPERSEIVELAQWKHVAGICRFHTRNAADALDYILVSASSFRDIAACRLDKANLEGKQVLRFKAGICLPKIANSAKQESRAGQQHQRDRHLADYQRALCPMMSTLSIRAHPASIHRGDQWSGP